MVQYQVKVAGRVFRSCNTRELVRLAVAARKSDNRRQPAEAEPHPVKEQPN